jgi:hypothetical protein
VRLIPPRDLVGFPRVDFCLEPSDVSRAYFDRSGKLSTPNATAEGNAISNVASGYQLLETN